MLCKFPPSPFGDNGRGENGALIWLKQLPSGKSSSEHYSVLSAFLKKIELNIGVMHYNS